MNCNNLDERQLMIRGNIFREGLILAFVLLIFDAFLRGDIIRSEGIVWVEGMWGNILFIVVITVYCLIRMICREVFDMENKTSFRLMMILGCAGVFLLVWGGIEILVGADAFISGGILTEDGAQLLTAAGWTVVGITALVKRLRLSREDEE